MVVLYFLLLFATFGDVCSDIHTLQYIYTALSKPVEMPGVYEFTAMGILDHRPIDYYNSKEKLKKPMQDWMKENLDKDYWQMGTQSRKSKEQWFSVNINILMGRMNHNVSEVHILQWMHGCEVDISSPGVAPKFVRGFDQYGYDGEDFLSFNIKNMQWVAPVIEAESTKMKWDRVDVLNQYTKGYLERECTDWLNRFLSYQDKQLSAAARDSPPKVFVSAKKSFWPGYLTLMCLATEFYPKDVTVDILRGELRLDESDGVTSTGVRPNGMKVHGEQETFQLRKTLEIKQSDTDEYSCVIKHRTISKQLVVKWDGKWNSEEGIGGGVVILILILIVGLALALALCYRFSNHIRGFLCRERPERPKRPFVDDVVKNGGPGGQDVALLHNGLKPDAKPLNENGSKDSADSGKGSVGSESSKEDLSNDLDKGLDVSLLHNGLNLDAEPLNKNGSKDSADSGKGSVGSESSKEDLSNDLDKGLDISLLHNGLNLDAEPLNKNGSKDSADSGKGSVGSESSKEDLSNDLDKGLDVSLLHNGLNLDAEPLNKNGSKDSADSGKGSVGSESSKEDLSNDLDKGQQGADVV